MSRSLVFSRKAELALAALADDERAELDRRLSWLAGADHVSFRRAVVATRLAYLDRHLVRLSHSHYGVVVRRRVGIRVLDVFDRDGMLSFLGVRRAVAGKKVGRSVEQVADRMCRELGEVLGVEGCCLPYEALIRLLKQVMCSAEGRKLSRSLRRITNHVEGRSDHDESTSMVKVNFHS